MYCLCLQATKRKEDEIDQMRLEAEKRLSDVKDESLEVYISMDYELEISKTHVASRVCTTSGMSHCLKMWD